MSFANVTSRGELPDWAPGLAPVTKPANTATGRASRSLGCIGGSYAWKPWQSTCPHGLEPGPSGPRSKEILHPELHLPRAARDRVEDPPERRARHRRGRESEARVVPDVGRVHAELQRLPAGDARPLGDADVQVREHRPAEEIPADVAELTGIRIREFRPLVRSEVPDEAAFVVDAAFAPAAPGAIGRRLDDVRERVAARVDCDRPAALDHELTRELPPSQQAAIAKRQLPHELTLEHVRPIEIRQRVIERSIVDVERRAARRLVVCGADDRECRVVRARVLRPRERVARKVTDTVPIPPLEL